MSDEEIRTAERNWRASGLPQDEAVYRNLLRRAQGPEPQIFTATFPRDVRLARDLQTRDRGDGVMLQWPSSRHWYPLLEALHETLARAERMSNADKDILLPYNLDFQPDGHYERLIGLDVTMLRFSERTNGHADGLPERDAGRKYRITLRWVSHSQVGGFDYERLQ